MLMKVTTEILRCTKVKTSELIGILDISEEESKSMTVSKINSIILEQFGPLADSFKILWTPDQDLDQAYTLCGIGVMKFETLNSNEVMPQVKIHHYIEDINPENLTRVDGALFSELNRLGIYTDIKRYSLKAITTVEGN